MVFVNCRSFCTEYEGIYHLLACSVTVFLLERNYIIWKNDTRPRTHPDGFTNL